MGNIFNDDFRDFIQALNTNEVEYLLVGGYAVILHGYRRTTGDMDIWVNTTRNNLQKLKKAFLQFGLPTSELTKERFLKDDSVDVFTYGRPPLCIDIMKVVKGLQFDEAFASSEIYVENNLQIRFINYDQLIKAKESSGRHKDMDDIEKLK
jgi:hypothetical protein